MRWTGWIRCTAQMIRVMPGTNQPGQNDRSPRRGPASRGLTRRGFLGGLGALGVLSTAAVTTSCSDGQNTAAKTKVTTAPLDGAIKPASPALSGAQHHRRFLAARRCRPPYAEQINRRATDVSAPACPCSPTWNRYSRRTLTHPRDAMFDATDTGAQKKYITLFSVGNYGNNIIKTCFLL